MVGFTSPSSEFTAGKEKPHTVVNFINTALSEELECVVLLSCMLDCDHDTSDMTEHALYNYKTVRSLSELTFSDFKKEIIHGKCVIRTVGDHRLKTVMEGDYAKKLEWYRAREKVSLEMRNNTRTDSIDNFFRSFEREYFDQKSFNMKQWLQECLKYWKAKATPIGEVETDAEHVTL